MVTVNAPLRADQFRTKAEALGLTFVSKAGMKMKFSAPAGQDADLAAKLKKQSSARTSVAVSVKALILQRL